MQVPHPRPKDYSCLYFAISNNNNNDSNGNEKSYNDFAYFNRGGGRGEFFSLRYVEKKFKSLYSS